MLLLGVAAAPAPVSVFTPGRNLCRAATLADVRSAGGQRYRPGVFAAGTCTWERADLAAGLSTHPSAAGLELIHQFLGQARIAVRRVATVGTSEAIVVTVSPGSKYLFAAYPRGVIQVNMTAPRAPSDARLLAVLRLVAPKA